MRKEISLARITGYLMGDGNVSRRYLRYNNRNVFLLENFKKHFLNLYPLSHFIEGKVNSGTSFVQVQNKQIINFLFNLCGDFRSGNLRFPKFLKHPELKREFISSIFDDEGCVSLRVFRKTNEIKRNLEIASKSKEFLEEIKEVLEKDFQIKCNNIICFNRNWDNKKFLTWKLSITGKENFVRFRENINFNSPDKIKKLDNMINSYIRK